jgi:hypothetical protein
VPLAERYMKKPRTTEKGETATGTDQGAISFEVASSSPQCEAHIQFPLPSTIIDPSKMETDKEAGSDQPEGERQGMDPLTEPSSSELPPRPSSTRNSPTPGEHQEEPTHIEAPPTTDVAGDRATTTDVAGGRASSPSHAHQGKFLFRCHLILANPSFLSS